MHIDKEPYKLEKDERIMCLSLKKEGAVHPWHPKFIAPGSWCIPTTFLTDAYPQNFHYFPYHVPEYHFKKWNLWWKREKYMKKLYSLKKIAEIRQIYQREGGKVCDWVHTVMCNWESPRPHLCSKCSKWSKKMKIRDKYK